MKNYLEFWAPIRDWLSSSPLGVAGPVFALMFALWGAFYIVRTFFPALWLPLTKWPSEDNAISHIVQGFPSMIMGAIVGGGTTFELKWTLLGALGGVLAPVWHHLVKLSPVAYQGALRDAANRWVKAARNSGLMLLVLLLWGCTKQLPPDEPIYQTCQAAALAISTAESAKLCPVPEGAEGKERRDAWDLCEHRAAIMDRLKTNQEACRK